MARTCKEVSVVVAKIGFKKMQKLNEMQMVTI